MVIIQLLFMYLFIIQDKHAIIILHFFLYVFCGYIKYDFHAKNIYG